MVSRVGSPNNLYPLKPLSSPSLAPPRVPPSVVSWVLSPPTSPPLLRLPPPPLIHRLWPLSSKPRIGYSIISDVETMGLITRERFLIYPTQLPLVCYTLFVTHTHKQHQNQSTFGIVTCCRNLQRWKTF
ncbi:hypothetical protein HanPI659440_Chr07g0274111 [Helianthus annuus]|nr:hypothetical protein HanPI659440_Chr07g0274111 [Helianthus annuus]